MMLEASVCDVGSATKHEVPSKVGLEPELLSARALAKILTVSERHLWRMKSAGQLLDPVRLGGSVRWRRREVLDWIDAGLPDRATWQREKQRASKLAGQP